MAFLSSSSSSSCHSGWTESQSAELPWGRARMRKRERRRSACTHAHRRQWTARRRCPWLEKGHVDVGSCCCSRIRIRLMWEHITHHGTFGNLGLRPLDMRDDLPHETASSLRHQAGHAFGTYFTRGWEFTFLLICHFRKLPLELLRCWVLLTLRKYALPFLSKHIIKRQCQMAWLLNASLVVALEFVIIS